MKKFLFLFTLLSITFARETGARYLIITHDNFYDAILPYAQWKHKMGYRTKIVRVPSELGQNSNAIRNYIVNAYNNWQIRPEFILLVGAPNYIPWYSSSPYSDNGYTDINGDIYNDILSGRLTVHSLTETQTVVNKMLLYERTPDTTSNWLINACLIVREDYEPYSDSIYWSDIRYARNLMMINEYEIIDTLCRAAGNNSSNVVNSVNAGRGFVLYRGQGVGNWWSPFDVNPDNTQNGAKLPIVLSITCQTIGSGSTPATAEKWLLTGTPTSPRGGAGYFATTTIVTHQAYLRSAVCKGFFKTLFEDRKYRFGEACEGGRQNVYSLYGSTTEYRGFTTLGDPAMYIWTAKPRIITVAYDSILYAGVEETLNIVVQYQGTPVESAFVCIHFDTLIYQTAYTNSNGEVVFVFTPALTGVMDITVTGRNLYPFEGTAQIVTDSVFLSYAGNSINDSLGNNNGIINPGETILLWARIQNLGMSPAPGVNAILRTTDNSIVITDSLSLYGNIPQGNEQSGLNPFVFSTSPWAQNHPISFEIVITDAIGDTFVNNFSIMMTGTGSGATGPDPYGYYIYDDTDTLSGNAPTYNWFEIAPPGPGIIVSEITDEDADTVTYPLPFNFPYYGITYTSIGFCSNGFLELGGSTYRFGSNTSIPLSGGPKRLIAPFWDDLDPRPEPSGFGDIYYYNDTTNHRWIVEYKDCAHYGNTSARETFQIILLDPQYYPTPTGDGEILFYYNTVSNPAENTIGIEDETETRGLQYVFDNSYDPNAAPITNHRALLVTTKPPITQHSPWLNLLNYTISDSAGGNNNGIPEPGETIEITLYLKNNGDTMVTSVDGTLQANTTSLSLIDSVANFGDIDIGQVSENSSNPYVLQISETPSDTIVGIVVYLTGNNGNYNTTAYFTFRIHSEGGVKESNFDIDNGIVFKVYPNPFQNHCVIKFEIRNPKSQTNSNLQIPNTELQIYDVTGRLVKQFNHLTDCQFNYVLWYGDDDLGRKLPAGVYFVKLESEGFKQVEKVILLR